MASFKENNNYRKEGMQAERSFVVNGRPEQVTPRELEILMLLRSGITLNNRLAHELHVSPHTVKNRMSRLYHKFGFAGTTSWEFKKIQLLQAAIISRVIPPFSLIELAGTPLPSAFEVELPELRQPRKPRKIDTDSSHEQ